MAGEFADLERRVSAIEEYLRPIKGLAETVVDATGWAEAAFEDAPTAFVYDGLGWEPISLDYAKRLDAQGVAVRYA